MNIQYAVKDGEVYVLEVNPRASRTVPFVSKAIGLPLAKIAAKVMAGAKLRELGVTREVAVRALLGQGVGLPVQPLPRRGHRARAGDEVHRRGHGHRPRLRPGLRQEPVRRRAAAARRRAPSSSRSTTATRSASCRSPGGSLDLGFNLCATTGTAAALNAAGVSACRVLKVHEGRPNVVDMLKNREIQLIINTPARPARQGRPARDPARGARAPHHDDHDDPRRGRGRDRDRVARPRRADGQVLQEYHAGKTF